jgi:hypothetical protein
MATRKRSELNEKFVHELALDFETHGAEVIEKLRLTDLRAYSQLVAALVPRRLEVSDDCDSIAHLSEAELEDLMVKMFAQSIAHGARIMAKAEALLESGEVLPDLPPPPPRQLSRRLSRRPGLPMVRGQ